MLNSGGKNFALCATKKINILTLMLTEKKILNEKKPILPPTPCKLNGRSLTLLMLKITVYKMSDYRGVALSGCRTIEVSDYRGCPVFFSWASKYHLCPNYILNHFLNGSLF